MKKVIMFVFRLLLAILATVIFIAFTPIYIVSLCILFFYKEEEQIMSSIIDSYCSVWVGIWFLNDID